MKNVEKLLNQVNQNLKNQLLELQKNPSFIQEILKDRKVDEQIILIAIELNHLCFKYLDDKYKTEAVILRAITKDEMMIGFNPDYYKDDENMIKKVLIFGSEYTFLFNFVSERLKDDRVFVLQLLNKRIVVYPFISERLKRDLTVLSEYSFYFFENYHKNENIQSFISHIPSDVLKDREVITHLVQINPLLVDHLDSCFINDEIIYKSLQTSPLLINILNETYKEDREIVKSVVSVYGELLSCVSKKFLNDTEIVTLALQKQGKYELWCLLTQYRLEQYKLNVEFLKLNIIEILPKKYKENREFLLLSMNKNVSKTVFEYLKDHKDQEMFFNLFGKYFDYENSYIFERYSLVPDNLKQDFNFNFNLIKFYYCQQLVRQNFLEDKVFVEAAIEKGANIRYFTKFHDDKALMLKAVRNDYNNISYVSERLKNDPEFLYFSVLNGSKFTKDKELILKAYQEPYFYLKNPSEEILEDREFMKKLIAINPSTFSYDVYLYYYNKGDTEMIIYGGLKNEHMTYKVIPLLPVQRLSILKKNPDCYIFFH